jgi:hypothetical protein
VVVRGSWGGTKFAVRIDLTSEVKVKVVRQVRHALHPSSFFANMTSSDSLIELLLLPLFLLRLCFARSEGLLVGLMSVECVTR